MNVTTRVYSKTKECVYISSTPSDALMSELSLVFGFIRNMIYHSFHWICFSKLFVVSVNCVDLVSRVIEWVVSVDLLRFG